VKKYPHIFINPKFVYESQV